MFNLLGLIAYLSLSVLEFGESVTPNSSRSSDISTRNDAQIRCESWWNECQGEFECTKPLHFQGTTMSGGCLYRIPQSLSRAPGECVFVANPHDNSSGSGECKFVNPCVARLQSCSTSEYECVAINSTKSIPNCSSIAISPPPPDRPCVSVNGSCTFSAHQCVKWRGFCNAGYKCGTAVDQFKFAHGPQPMCAPPPPGSLPPLPPGECIFQNGHCVWSGT